MKSERLEKADQIQIFIRFFKIIGGRAGGPKKKLKIRKVVKFQDVLPI